MKDVLAFVTMELVQDRSWQDEEFEELHVLELEKLAAQAVPPSAESIKRGSELVVESKCIECHGLEGRGDGNAFNLKDDWGFSIQTGINAGISEAAVRMLIMLKIFSEPSRRGSMVRQCRRLPTTPQLKTGGILPTTSTTCVSGAKTWTLRAAM
jgi:hypothetical protein